MIDRRSIATALALAMTSLFGVTATARAQLDPPVFTSGTETGTRYNLNSSATYGPDSVAYEDCYVFASGGSHLRLNQLSVGIRRVGTAAAPAPAVGVEVTVVEMTFDGLAYGRGATVATFNQELAVSTTAFTQPVSFSWGDADPALRPIVNLQTQTQGLNGYGGFWVGVRFTGPNYANTANGWRVVNEPTIGRAVNNFGIYNALTGVFGSNFWFGQTADATTGALRDNPARFVVNTNGLVTDSVVSSELRYGDSFEHTTYWKPTDNLDGIGSKWFYTNCFVPAVAGDVLTPSEVIMGIYRAGSVATPALAVGVELALVTMIWDGVAYTPGKVIASQSFNLAPSSIAFTERVAWQWLNPATRPEVPLNTDNVVNAGLGGYFVAARMLGDTATLAGNSGPRIVYAPGVGTSSLGFGMFSDTGVFTNYTFGNYANGTAAGPTKPSRFLSDTKGRVGPSAPPPPACPADLDQNGSVSAPDLATLLGGWGTPSGDVNGDGTTNATDLSAMLSSWGPCP